MIYPDSRLIGLKKILTGLNSGERFSPKNICAAIERVILDVVMART